ncbi:piggyBac transposable element-derived protein 4-like [Alosa sapidissima]|uniref:piggyBac transposable element-derived protein 4-like n=1 Tax=Alosa sapidissima TaxID=34773 RepID=UPI001C0806D9|nr:piggyBac transposable element-derived protein 4-like [Alosa sapidissima]
MPKRTKNTEDPLKEAAGECLPRESNEENNAVAESMAESVVSAAAEENLEEEGDFELESESEDSDLESADEESDSEPEPPARRPKRGTGSKGIEETTTSSPVEAWNGTDEEDIAPEPPSFRPARTPGAQLLNGVSYTVLDLFQCFLSNSILQTIVINTNKYGQENHTKWKKITLKDLYSYLSMLIYSGFFKVTSMSDYWKMSELYTFSFPSTVMSCKKFSDIAGSIQLSDPKDDAANNKKKGTADYDRLCKIKPMYEEVRQSCKACYHPRQNIAVDERLVKSKARTGLKQYMKNKRRKWGFKFFVLADSSNGYTWDFTVFEGKNHHRTGKGLGYDTVMDLVTPKVLGTGYKLYVDNFYTSRTLFLDLLEKRIRACGTIRSNQLGPLRLKSGQLDKKSPRGCIRWIREGPIVFVQWKDTRDVLMCSTIHKAHGEDTIQRNMKDVEGQWAMNSIAVPPAILDYNKNMGAVDHSDALISYYNVLHRTKRWYRSFFYHFVDIAVVNAFILHKELASAKGERVMTQKKFRETLVLELRAAGTPNTAAQRAPLFHSDNYPNACTIRGVSHMPVYFTPDSTQGRRRCVLCHLKTPLGCSTCDKPLCFRHERQCFNLWHDQL